MKEDGNKLSLSILNVDSILRAMSLLDEITGENSS